MPTDEQLFELWASEFALGIRPEDSYGDEHFADDPEFLRERNYRIAKISNLPLDVATKRRYLEFENLCYMK